MRGRLPRVGQYTGDGAAGLSVDLGFEPMFVLIINYTDKDVMTMAINGQTDAHGVQIDTAVAGISSAGITISKTGFSVGTDAKLIESGKVYRWVAF